MADMSVEKQTGYILGIGGANIDIISRLKSDAYKADSNPGRVSCSLGGVCRNVIENLARLNIPCKMLTAVGDDLFGRQLIRECEGLGIDMSRVLVSNENPTGTYLAILDKDGELLISSADTRVIENIPLSYFEENKELIANASAIVCDPNLEKQQLLKIKELAKDVRIFIDPTSGSKAKKLIEIKSVFYFMKPNLLELESLSAMCCKSDEDIVKAAASLIKGGVTKLAVSLGKRGCYYCDADKGFFKELPIVLDAANVTGAGDAFMAGMIYGYSKGYCDEECIKLALSAGAIAVESEKTINESMSESRILECRNKYY